MTPLNPLDDDDDNEPYVAPPPRAASSPNPPPKPAPKPRRPAKASPSPFPGDTGNARAEWRKKIQLSNSATPIPNLYNAKLALDNHWMFPIVKYDEMMRLPFLVREPDGSRGDLPRPLADNDVTVVQHILQDIGFRRVVSGTVADAMMMQAVEHKFHPVRDYLEKLRWDHNDRIDTWLVNYLGADVPDNDDLAKKVLYYAEIGKRFLIAMVARIMRPGCKADHMIVLEGPQGARKSSACRALAGGLWFSDNLPDIKRGDPVRVSMHLRGKWLVEIGEMSSFGAAEVEDIKKFISQCEEIYTPKYGRYEVHEPRQCLFIGSTNDEHYLRDATGARRFWPVKCGTIDLPALTADRDQLFAEAMHLFMRDEPWWPHPELERTIIAPEQAARFDQDAWQPKVVMFLAQNALQVVTVGDIFDHLSIPIPQQTRSLQMRVSNILKHLGWKLMRNTQRRWYAKPT
jgi:predicted P-loop ATPase